MLEHLPEAAWLPPPGFEYLSEVYRELFLANAGGLSGGIDHTAIGWYCHLYRVSLEPWEIRAILEVENRRRAITNA